MSSFTTPPLTWLRAFEASARHLSFTRAADELGLTQSAVSQHVRALEHRLGHTLFLRTHRQLRLSDAGRLLLPDVTAGLSLLGEATSRFGKPQEAQTLRIATSASVARHVLAARLPGFRAERQGVTLEVRSTVWPDEFAGMPADLEIRFGREQMVGRDAVLLEPSYLHAVATPEIAKAFGAGADIALIEAIGISAQWSDVLPDAKADVRVDTHGLAVDFARDGIGAALTHGLISHDLVASGELVALNLNQLPAREGYFLAVRDGSSSALARDFADWLVGELADHKRT